MEIIAGLVEIPLSYLLAATAAVLLYLYSTWTFSTWSKQGIRGPYPLPFLGNVPETVIRGGFHRADLHWRRKYGKFVALYTGRTPTLGVSDPDFLKEAMVKQFSSLPNRSLAITGGLFNLFLTVLKDDHWRHVRSSLTPTFTTGKLKQMKSLIDQCADHLVEHMEETEGKPFDTKALAGCYSMDVIASTAFGIQVDSRKNPEDPLILYAQDLMGSRRYKSKWKKILDLARISLIFILPDFIMRNLTKIGFSPISSEAFDYFTKLCGQVLKQREHTTTESARKDFVQLCKDRLVDEPKPGDPDYQVDSRGEPWTTKGLTRNEIIANAMIFFLAGYETTATTLNFIFYELAMNPDIQEKFWQRNPQMKCCTTQYLVTVLSVMTDGVMKMGQNNLKAYQEIIAHCSQEEATYDDLAKLEYMDLIIDETLRLYPPAARVDRTVDKDVKINGIYLPAGSVLNIMIYGLHIDPDVFPDPMKFDPERFTPENKAGRHSCAFMPFGVGNRNCIGMRLALLEIKLALVKVLTKFELRRCATTVTKPVAFKSSFQLDTEKPNEVAAILR